MLVKWMVLLDMLVKVSPKKIVQFQSEVQR